MARTQHAPADGPARSREQDLFRPRLEDMIDPKHPLVRVGEAMPWEALIDAVGESLPAIPAGAGCRPLPARLMLGLLYLKYAYDLSDEAVCQRWLENPYWQHFCGEVFFQTRLPCDPSSLTRYRNHLDEAGVEELLAQTISAAKDLKAIRPRHLERVIVDTTVQEKAVAHPTDSRLLEVCRQKLVDAADHHGIHLRQSYARKGPEYAWRAGRYAHARQFKRMRRMLKKQRTIVGRLIRDIDRKAGASRQALAPILLKAEGLKNQQPKDKNKLYAWHAEEVECIGKGKARQPYEFGVKASIAISATGNLIVGARSFPGNPYDGHTLAEQLEQTRILTDHEPMETIVDLGYRGRDLADIPVRHRGRIKSMTASQRRWLKRRQAVEPVIGHLKAEHRMRRNHLKGQLGDALNVVLAAAGYNLRWLMRWLVAFCARFWSGLTLVRLLDRLRDALERFGSAPTPA